MRLRVFFAKVMMACVVALSLTACARASTKSAGTFQIGVKTETSYNNPYFDIAFDLPEGFIFLTDEEIALTVSAVQESLTDAQSALDAMESGETYFEAIALDQTTNAQINIAVAKAPVSIENVSVDGLIDVALSELTGALESMGATEVTGARGTTTFKDETIPCAEISFSSSGIRVYERQILLLKDAYVATITTSTFGADDTQSLVDAFTAAK